MTNKDFKWKENLYVASFESCDYEDEKEFEQLEADILSGEIEKVYWNGDTFTDDHQICVEVDVAYKNGNQYKFYLMWVGASGVTAVSKAVEGSYKKLNKILKSELYILD